MCEDTNIQHLGMEYLVTYLLQYAAENDDWNYTLYNTDESLFHLLSLTANDDNDFPHSSLLCGPPSYAYPLFLNYPHTKPHTFPLESFYK